MQLNVYHSIALKLLKPTSVQVSSPPGNLPWLPGSFSPKTGLNISHTSSYNTEYGIYYNFSFTVF